jgi:DNA-binding CsgD family transcriptional regulator
VLRRAVLSGVADPVIRLAATSIAAVVAIAEGRLAEGKVLADEALRSAEDGLRNAPQASLAYTAVASGWAEEGRLEEARRELLRALQSRRRWLEMSPWPTLEIMFRLAAVLHGMGDDAGAATLVTEIDDALTSLPDGAEAQRARLELLSQRLGAGPGTEPTREGQELGLTDREMTVLRMLRGTMSIAEIAQELRLSSNTIKTHIRAIYRKLDVSARPAAVTRAREVGLLLADGLFEVVEPRPGSRLVPREQGGADVEHRARATGSRQPRWNQGVMLSVRSSCGSGKCMITSCAVSTSATDGSGTPSACPRCPRCTGGPTHPRWCRSPRPAGPR